MALARGHTEAYTLLSSFARLFPTQVPGRYPFAQFLLYTITIAMTTVSSPSTLNLTIRPHPESSAGIESYMHACVPRPPRFRPFSRTMAVLCHQHALHLRPQPSRLILCAVCFVPCAQVFTCALDCDASPNYCMLCAHDLALPIFDALVTCEGAGHALREISGSGCDFCLRACEKLEVCDLCCFQACSVCRVKATELFQSCCCHLLDHSRVERLVKGACAACSAPLASPVPCCNVCNFQLCSLCQTHMAAFCTRRLVCQSSASFFRFPIHNHPMISVAESIVGVCYLCRHPCPPTPTVCVFACENIMLCVVCANLSVMQFRDPPFRRAFEALDAPDLLCMLLRTCAILPFFAF
jgi:hypothetical protein